MATISVIVPVYKVEAFLPRCVDSILAQTFSDFELWLVDDGSPDRCGEICEEYAEKDARVRVIHKKNGGLSDARNAALDVMTGAYVEFVDSDDWLAPDTLENMLTALKQNDCDMAVCNIVEVHEDGTQKPLYHPTDTQKVLTGDAIFETLLQPSACNKLYKAAIFRTLRYPFGKLHEDVAVYHDVLAQVQKIVYTGKDSYFYFQRDGSITYTPYTLRSTDLIDAVYARANKLDELGQPKLANEARLFVYSQLAVAYAKLDKKEPQNAARLQELKAMYEDCYPKLMADASLSRNQKIRMWLLHVSPSVHTAVFGKKMPQN